MSKEFFFSIKLSYFSLVLSPRQTNDNDDKSFLVGFSIF